MTPKRKQALQWFYDRGEVGWFPCDGSGPSRAMRVRLENDGLIQRHNNGDMKVMTFTLTDAGRQALHEAD